MNLSTQMMLVLDSSPPMEEGTIKVVNTLPCVLMTGCRHLPPKPAGRVNVPRFWLRIKGRLQTLRQ
jgi:hypothetical protein